MKKSSTLELVLAALFIAIGLLLPSVFHMFSIGGTAFLPMHIPVLLCGLILGWKYGLVVGVVVPLLTSLLTAKPPIYPTAISMAFELGTYGIVSGLLYKKYNKNIFVSLIGAMLAGRLVMGIANLLLYGLQGNSYSFSAFISGAFVTAIPGIIIQIILIPIIMAALEKSNVLERLNGNQ